MIQRAERRVVAALLLVTIIAGCHWFTKKPEATPVQQVAR
jgi:hypothetical protein